MMEVCTPRSMFLDKDWRSTRHHSEDSGICDQLLWVYINFHFTMLKVKAYGIFGRTIIALGRSSEEPFFGIFVQNFIHAFVANEMKTDMIGAAF